MSQQPKTLLNVDQLVGDYDIFLTGGSGFIGTGILYKLLQLISRKKSYDKHIYVLLRNSSKYKNVDERLTKQVMNNEIFDEFKDKMSFYIKNYIHAIEGDLVLPLLGVSDTNINIIKSNNLNKLIFIHCAADIQFDRPLNKAMSLNVNGTYECINLGLKCGMSCFLHISTLYVNARESRNAIVNETVYDQGFNSVEIFNDWKNRYNSQFTMNKVKDIMSKKRILNNNNLSNWPNTYTFTKNIAENIAIHYCNENNIPLSIARLGIVSPWYHGKNKGWFLGTGGFVLLAIGSATGHIKWVKGDGKGRPDYVPADFTCNGIIGICADLIYKTRTKNIKHTVFQLGVANEQDKNWNIQSVFDYCTPRVIEANLPGAVPNAGTDFISNGLIFWLIEYFIFDLPLMLSIPFEWVLSNFYFLGTKTSIKFIKKLKFLRKARKKMIWFNNSYSWFLNQRWHFTTNNVKHLYNTLDTESRKYYDFNVETFTMDKYTLDCVITCTNKWYERKAKLKKQREILEKEKQIHIIESQSKKDMERKHIMNIIRQIGISFGGFGQRNVSYPWIISFSIICTFAFVIFML